MAQGYVPARVMEMFAANDTEHDYRQIAIMDREGRIAAHTGSGTRGWVGPQGRHRLRGVRQRPGRARRCWTA